ncbi:hypothetical protein [Methanocalculus sp. MSAO_Arc2]|uniref:hypothetical protein n=1 Tax=Methanocalculus sp. MSAO_Arc2 TaxID=2293855 RepID=UPI003217C6E6
MGWEMKIYKIEEDDRLVPYNERDFKQENMERNLEIWLENNPHCLLEDEMVLVIGRQVFTNLNSVIDLLAVDKNGDLIVIELKRDRTPRETIAQVLEYASFVEDLSYQQLEEVFSNYIRDENTNLADYHRNYFKLQEDEAVAFNKNQKMMIIAQNITKDIKQVAIFLRKTGIDIYCLAFKYFTNQDGNKIISTDYIVGKDTDSIKKVISGSLPKIDKQIFLESLNSYGKDFFKDLLEFAEKNHLPIHWGSKGFSLNVDLNGERVNILQGFPPHAVLNQGIYTRFIKIIQKVENGESIVNDFREKLNNFGGFESAGSELKLMINDLVTEDRKEELLTIISETISRIEKNGLKYR